MALIVGSIISVGTFNLPTFPGGLQPDRSHLDGADDSGQADSGCSIAVARSTLNCASDQIPAFQPL